jgi:hypothetical protein
MELIPLLLFALICLALMGGYPVAFTLAGTSLLFAGVGVLTDTFDMAFLNAMPNRIYGTMTNANLFAVPMFVFMGIMLEKSRIAESLLTGMARLFGTMRGGLGISVILVQMSEASPVTPETRKLTTLPPIVTSPESHPPTKPSSAAGIPVILAQMSEASPVTPATTKSTTFFPMLTSPVNQSDTNRKSSPGRSLIVPQTRRASPVTPDTIHPTIVAPILARPVSQAT